MEYIINPLYLPNQSKRRRGFLMNPGVRFIVAHDTGNPGSTARRNVNWFDRTAFTVPDNEISSAHIFVDDKEILECIPVLTGPAEKASHVLRNLQTDNTYFGFNANDAAIGVEYCYGEGIDADEAYRKYVWVLAYACYKYKLDPKTKITSHSFLDPGRKFDPQQGLSYSRRPFGHLLVDVAEEFNIISGLPPFKYNEVNQSGIVTTTARLNIRKGAPTTKVPVVQVVDRGLSLAYIAYVENGELVNGNPRWYKDKNGNFFWSGGVTFQDAA